MFATPGPAKPGGARLTPEEEAIVEQEKKFMETLDRGRGGVLGGGGGGGDSHETVEALNTVAVLLKELLLEAQASRTAMLDGQRALNQRLDELSKLMAAGGAEARQLPESTDQENGEGG